MMPEASNQRLEHERNESDGPSAGACQVTVAHAALGAGRSIPCLTANMQVFPDNFIHAVLDTLDG